MADYKDLADCKTVEALQQELQHRVNTIRIQFVVKIYSPSRGCEVDFSMFWLQVSSQAEKLLSGKYKLGEQQLRCAKLKNVDSIDVIEAVGNCLKAQAENNQQSNQNHKPGDGGAQHRLTTEAFNLSLFASPKYDAEQKVFELQQALRVC